MRSYLVKELKATFLDSTFKHVKYSNFPESFWGNEDTKITVSKEEKFALQLMLNYAHTETLYTLNRGNTISWKGLIDRVRIDLKVPDEIKEHCDISFVGYLKDDTGEIVNATIHIAKSVLVEQNISQYLWIEGKVPEDCNLEDIDIKIDVFTQKGYEDEEKVKNLDIKVNVIDFVLPDPNTCDDFHLDLWQHPSNWARAYKVELWSDPHFKIIENNLREL